MNGSENIATAYLTRIMQAQRRHELSIQAERELRTLAESLGALLAGEATGAADVLVQTFIAVEMAETDGNWSVATHLELIPPRGISAATTFEREEAVSLELAERKLKGLTTRRHG